VAVLPEPHPPSWRAFRALRRALGHGAVALTVALLTLLVSAAPAQAKPTAAEVRKQIAALNEQIETIVEQYNGVNTKLASDQLKAKRLRESLGPAQLQAAFAEDQVGEIARHIYLAGPSSALNALLNMSSTNAMLDQLGALETIAKGQRNTVTTATMAVGQYRAQQVTLDALIASESAQAKQLAAKKTQILAQLAKLKTLQDQLAQESTTTSGGSGSGGGGSGSGSGGGGSGKTSKSYVEPVSCPQSSGSGLGHTAVLKACSLVWSDKAPHIHWYGWGQAGPDRYDCSGFTMTAWKAAGVTLAHFTGDQYKETTRISRSQLQVGDLVFYYSDHHHVAIYIGNGYIAQAEMTGEPLKVSKIGSPSAYGHPHK
jgi:peptidoglycan DL-endopeptidase CwlO